MPRSSILYVLLEPLGSVSPVDIVTKMRLAPRLLVTERVGLLHTASIDGFLFLVLVVFCQSPETLQLFTTHSTTWTMVNTVGAGGVGLNGSG